MKRKIIYLLIMILFSICIFNNIHANEKVSGIIPPEEAGISILGEEENTIKEVIVKDPYEDMNALEIALANKTTVLWIVVSIVIGYLIITIVVLKLTKKRWK